MKTYFTIATVLCFMVVVPLYAKECDCFFTEGYFGGAGDTVTTFYIYRDGHHTSFLPDGDIHKINEITILDTVTEEVYSYIQKATNVKKIRICNWRHSDYNRIYALLSVYPNIEYFEVCDKSFGNTELALLSKLPLRSISIETEQPLAFTGRWKYPQYLTTAYITTTAKLQFEKKFSKRAGIMILVVGYNVTKGFPPGLVLLKNLQDVSFMDMSNLDAEKVIDELRPIAANLKAIAFDNCGIDRIPDSIISFINLETFTLFRSILKYNTDILNALPKLKQVYFFDARYLTEDKKRIKQELKSVKRVMFSD